MKLIEVRKTKAKRPNKEEEEEEISIEKVQKSPWAAILADWDRSTRPTETVVVGFGFDRGLDEDADAEGREEWRRREREEGLVWTRTRVEADKC